MGDKTAGISNDAVRKATGRDLWLGEADGWVLEKGNRFTLAAGGSGQIRSVAEGQRLRLVWQPSFLDHPTTLQVTFDPKGDRTAIRFHHEKLADADEREQMRAHWADVLERLRGVLAG